MDNGYVEGLSIDRIDETRGYRPDNCRWLTKSENARLAAAIMDSTTQLAALNQGQVASVCKVSLAYARLMRRPQSVPQLQAAE